MNGPCLITTPWVVLVALLHVTEVGGSDCSSGKCDAGIRADLPHPEEQPPMPPIPRIKLSDLKKTEFAAYAAGIRPFIATDVGMESWPAWTKWTWQHFAERFPREVVDFYPFNMLVEGGHPYLFRMGAALEEMFSTPAKGSRWPHKDGTGGRYLHYNLKPAHFNELARDCNYLPKFYRRNGWWLHKCMANDTIKEEYFLKTHWMILLVGTRGASMFNHSDSLHSSSWQAQVLGRKWWYICGKTDELNHVHCYEDVVQRGEMLFYPQMWSHRTMNLDSPTIALTGTVADSDNHEALAKALWDECVSSKHSFDLSGELCDTLHDCAKHWRDKFKWGAQLPSWREVATPEQIQKHDSMKPTTNNYVTERINE